MTLRSRSRLYRILSGEYRCLDRESSRIQRERTWVSIQARRGSQEEFNIKPSLKISGLKAEGGLPKIDSPPWVLGLVENSTRWRMDPSSPKTYRSGLIPLFKF